MTKRERRVFTEGFKREALRLIEQAAVQLRRLPMTWALAYQR